MKRLCELCILSVGCLSAAAFGQEQAANDPRKYVPNGIVQSPLAPLDSQEVALDVCGGRDKVYLQPDVDPTNINLLWSVRQVDQYVMFVSRVDDMALDANAGVGNPYPRQADASNINHLWLLCKVGEDYLIWSAVTNAVLDANGGQGRPYLNSNADPRNVNHLWSLRKQGDDVMLIPKVQRVIASHIAE
jgi:hypothetical protein